MEGAEWQGCTLHSGDSELPPFDLQRFHSSRPTEAYPCEIFLWKIEKGEVSLAQETFWPSDLEQVARHCMPKRPEVDAWKDPLNGPPRSILYPMSSHSMWLVMDNCGASRTHVVVGDGSSYRTIATSTADLAGELQIEVRTLDFDGNGSMDFWIGRYYPACGVGGTYGHSTVVLTDISGEKAAIHELGYCLDCDIVDPNADGKPELLVTNSSGPISGLSDSSAPLQYRLVGFEGMRMTDKPLLVPRELEDSLGGR